VVTVGTVMLAIVMLCRMSVMVPVMSIGLMVPFEMPVVAIPMPFLHPVVFPMVMLCRRSRMTIVVPAMITVISVGLSVPLFRAVMPVFYIIVMGFESFPLSLASVIPGPGGAARPNDQTQPYQHDSGDFRFHELLLSFSGFDGLDDSGQRTVDMKYPGQSVDLRCR
jgi:hypothetical protein